MKRKNLIAAAKVAARGYRLIHCDCNSIDRKVCVRVEKAKSGEYAGYIMQFSDGEWMETVN